MVLLGEADWMEALSAWHELLLLASPAPDLSKKPIQYRKPTMLRKNHVVPSLQVPWDQLTLLISGKW